MNGKRGTEKIPRSIVRLPIPDRLTVRVFLDFWEDIQASLINVSEFGAMVNMKSGRSGIPEPGGSVSGKIIDPKSGEATRFSGLCIWINRVDPNLTIFIMGIKFHDKFPVRPRWTEYLAVLKESS